ncbi:hypothetical protein [Gallibacterium anatis]|nr:hypothetical protein [Gallibacterium anatis]WIM81884.1 hypothetical protein QP019_11100 [Gallibacterium anatis]WKS97553.1 hypothetical protein NYR19_01680 [Gallibacterium anatis]
MSLILIKAKSGQRIDLSKVAKKGKYVELAVAGEEYHVIDSETGKTPEDLQVSRSGSDLIIKSKKDKIEVIIDEFWGECSAEQQCFAVFDSAAQGTEQGKVIVTQVEAEMSGFSSNDIASGTLTTSLENGQSFIPWAYAAGAAALLGGIALAAGGGSSGGKGSSHTGGGGRKH